jgi:hypothetical protein
MQLAKQQALVAADIMAIMRWKEPSLVAASFQDEQRDALQQRCSDGSAVTEPEPPALRSLNNDVMEANHYG